VKWNEGKVTVKCESRQDITYFITVIVYCIVCLFLLILIHIIVVRIVFVVVINVFALFVLFCVRGLVCAWWGIWGVL
jgi:hypothetical protein